MAVGIREEDYKRFMSIVRLVIKEISYSETQKGAFALVLGDADANRELRVVIGALEAQSIVVVIGNRNRKQVGRPLIHDLFKNLAEAFSIRVREVFIEKLEDGVFYSYMVCYSEDEGRRVRVDARTSDAIAIAVRFGVPIYTSEQIMQQGGVHTKLAGASRCSKDNQEAGAEQKDSYLTNGSGLDDLTLEELYEYLGLSVEEEDYEQAAFIRDEIERRKKL